MLKKIILAALIFVAAFGLISAKSTKKHLLHDGLYLVIKIDTVVGKLSPLSANETAVSFSKMFEEYNGDGFTRIIIDTSDYVPLELAKSPVTEQQTEAKKKLLLSLTKSASEKLKTFSAKNLMKHVVIVVDGEALTMHKIKAALTGGELQITRCTDNACEKLFIKLKENVKK